MPHKLKILKEATTVIDLEGATEADHHTLEYVPRSPGLDPVEVSIALESGGEIPITTYSNVTESALVLLKASTAALLQAEVRTIEDAFANAVRRQKNRTGDRYFVEFSPPSGDDDYRSEILNGRVELSPEAVDWQWTALRIEVLVVWTRRYYWEGSKVAIPLTNGNGTDVTAGIEVQNHNDGTTGDDNYVDIDQSDVIGALPSPIDLRMKRTDAYSNRGWNYYISNNVFSSPSSLDVIIEGEDSTGIGSTQSSGAASGGNYDRMTWSATVETVIAVFPLATSTLLNLTDGNYFRILLKFFSDPPTDLSFRWEIRYLVTPMWTGPLFAVSDTRRLQDGGVIQLPPALAGESNVAAMELWLYGLRVANPTTVELDYIQISPLDGWRELRSKGYGVIQNGFLNDDGIRRKLWSEPSGGGGSKVANFIGKGDPIVVWPDRDQRVYILHDASNGNAEIDRTHDVEISYRPRLTTI